MNMKGFTLRLESLKNPADAAPLLTRLPHFSSFLLELNLTLPQRSKIHSLSEKKIQEWNK